MISEKIFVIGGGPAGIMAAIRTAQLGKKVVLVEKNSQLGVKLLLTGKGRCNITNACDFDTFLNHFSKNGQFLRDSFKKFFNYDLIDFFEKRGLKLKTERQQRIFPVTDRSKSVVDVLLGELKKNNVTIRYNLCIKDIITENNSVKKIIFDNNEVIETSKIILATGGISYGFTGSTGDGFKIAKKLEHKVMPLRPGLVPLETLEKFPRILRGLTLKNIKIKFKTEKKEIISEIGELLFTDFGISGPLVLTLSGNVVDWLNVHKKVYAEIDLKPALSSEQLKNRINKEFELTPNRAVANVIRSFMPKALVSVFLEIAKIEKGRKISQITKSEKEKIVILFKTFPLTIVKAGSLNHAMVTQGGISLKDINPKTMESRITKGLYFAGEMIDIAADTGGFNLQAAFSTGYLAGESAAQN